MNSGTYWEWSKDKRGLQPVNETTKDTVLAQNARGSFSSVSVYPTGELCDHSKVFQYNGTRYVQYLTLHDTKTGEIVHLAVRNLRTWSFSWNTDVLKMVAYNKETRTVQFYEMHPEQKLIWDTEPLAHVCEHFLGVLTKKKLCLSMEMRS